MSRHRAVRNLDLDEELAIDDDYDDDPYEDLEPGDRESLDTAYATILDVLGPPDSANNPFSDREIKDALWDAYFDAEAVLDDLMKEGEKRRKKQQGEPVSEDEDQMDSEMSHLSLQSPPGSSQGPGNHLRGRAQGIAGLTSRGGRGGGGGRAGLAKRNLAALAPGGLPGVPVTTERAFGPQAGDVGTRSARQGSSSQPQSESIDAKTAPKPKSKLALLAEKKRAAAAGANQPAQANGLLQQSSPSEAPRSSPSKRASEAIPHTTHDLNQSNHLNPEQSSGIAAASPRPSKLMALAQGKKGSASNVNSQPEELAKSSQLPPSKDSSSSADPSAPSKPLSKLQQRALAARQEREERQRLAAKTSAPDSHGGAGTMDQMDVDGTPPDYRPLPSMRILPGGLSETSLFPVASDCREATAAKKSGTSTPQTPSKSSTKPKPGPSGLQVSSSSKASSAAASKIHTPREEKASALDGSSISNVSKGVESLELSNAPDLPKPASHEKILEEWKTRVASSDNKKEISVVVVGHVDAGKSTLMGRVLHDVGMMSDREHNANERASSKLGKGSFAYAWAMDASEEERERGVTISTAHAHFTLPHRAYTVLDAPGHRDFVPSMISGAAQADVAMLVIDATKGAFEAGFGPRGQTREHAVLIRALGVRELVVVVNKLDTVDYDQARYDEIINQLTPFLNSTGFEASRVKYVPCGASAGVNILGSGKVPQELSRWYKGDSLLDILDTLDPPSREVDGSLRLPLTNVFRGQTAISSGVAAAGRVTSGLIAVGDRVRVVPGDETATVRAIEQDAESVPWAVAGSSVTAYLAGIDEIHLAVGSILCPVSDPIKLSTNLTVQLLVFDPTYPILTGSSASLHHHSLDVPCTVTELVSNIGGTSTRKPRVLGKGSTAIVKISIASPGLPIEVNRKELSRILLRMNGETVAAGNVIECS
ncbi:unnamed protein product [Sympodiomycopsis kandeliae]